MPDPNQILNRFITGLIEKVKGIKENKKLKDIRKRWATGLLFPGPASPPHLPVDRRPPRAAAGPPPRLSHLTPSPCHVSLTHQLHPLPAFPSTAHCPLPLPSALPSWRATCGHDLEAQIELRAGKIERHRHHEVILDGFTPPMIHFAVQISSLL